MKIIPNLEELQKIIRKGADLKESEWALVKYNILEIDNIDTAEIVFRNRKSKVDITFKFQNGYIFCDELNPKMKQKLVQEYLKIYNNTALTEINKKIESAKECFANLVFDNIYDSQYLTNEQIGLDLNLMKQVLNINSGDNSFIILKTNNQVDLKTVNRGDIYTVENTIVVGANTFAKNRPFLVFAKDENAGLVYGTYLSTSSNDKKYSKKPININCFSKEYLKETGATESYLILNLFQPISSDRLISKVGQMDTFITIDILNEVIKFQKEISKNTTFVQNIKEPKQEEKVEIIKEVPEKYCLHKKGIDTASEINKDDELEGSYDWDKIEIKDKQFFQNSYGYFACDYNDVMVDISYADKIKEIFRDYCKEKRIRIANNENGLVFSETYDTKGKVIGAKININKYSRNRDYPSMCFTINAFTVKPDEGRSTNDELTKRLRQIQQNKNPYYYIYLTNFLFCISEKLKYINTEKDMSEFLENNGIKYNNSFVETKYLSIDDIYLDRNYFYDEVENEKE